MGELTQITMRHDNSGVGAAWHLDYVEVRRALHLLHISAVSPPYFCRISAVPPPYLSISLCISRISSANRKRLARGLCRDPLRAVSPPHLRCSSSYLVLSLHILQIFAVLPVPKPAAHSNAAARIRIPQRCRAAAPTAPERRCCASAGVR